jgi:hypothetical protein
MALFLENILVNSAIHSAVHVAAAPTCLPILLLGFPNVPTSIAELFGQLVNNIFKDDRVNILSHQID